MHAQTNSTCIFLKGGNFILINIVKLDLRNGNYLVLTAKLAYDTNNNFMTIFSGNI